VITKLSTAADEVSSTVSLGIESDDLVVDSSNEPSGLLRKIKFSRREYASRYSRRPFRSEVTSTACGIDTSFAFVAYLVSEIMDFLFFKMA